MAIAAFHTQLKSKMNDYVHSVYQSSRRFPREELYGITSQLRRSALSVVLNYVEGYARGRNKVHKNFLETSYGSLKESLYLLEFSLKEGFFKEAEYVPIAKLGDEIGAMIWGTIRNL